MDPVVNQVEVTSVEASKEANADSSSHTESDRDPDDANDSGTVCQQTCIDLYEAVIRKDIQQVESCLDGGIDINIEFDFVEHSDGTEEYDDDRSPSNKDLDSGNCPLHLVCHKNNLEVLNILLQRGADVNIVNCSGESALHIACKLGHVKCVERLIEKGADVDMCHSLIGGDTPLLTTVACYQPFFPKAEVYLEIVRVLIEAKCNVNATDSMGLAPLHVAVTKDNIEMTKLLVEAGADLNLQGRYVMAPLMRAVEQQNAENVKFLLDRQCQVNAVSFSGHTALSLCVESSNLAILLDLLECKPKVYASRVEFCPLHYAASYKMVLSLYLLIINGGYINTTNYYDKASLLLTLTRRSSVEGVKLLLRLGADPDIENRLGTTPLWAATKMGHQTLVRLFLQYNVDVETLSIEILPLKPLSALQLALELGYWDIANDLLVAGCELRPVWLATNNLSRQLRDNPERLKMLWLWLRQPRSLQQMCRKVIRSCLGQRIHKKLEKIAYPRKLCHYILTKTL